MSGQRSRQKGKRGERELAAALTAEGFDARRGVQYQGGPDSPDVDCPSLPRIHWEAKRCERLNLYDAVEQAKREAGDDQLPVVAHRRNRHDWVAILPLSALLAIIRESDLVATSTEATSRRLTPDLCSPHVVAPLDIDRSGAQGPSTSTGISEADLHPEEP